MSGRGNLTGDLFHGAFGTKAKAEAKERTVPGAWIEPIMMRGKQRWLVRSPRTAAALRKTKSNPKRKTRKNVSEGFWAGGVFHPIRRARDYDPLRGDGPGVSPRTQAKRKEESRRVKSLSAMRAENRRLGLTPRRKTKSNPSRKAIAESWSLWQEYVDPYGNMTHAEFNKLSVAKKIKMQNEMFGKEKSNPKRKKRKNVFPVSAVRHMSGRAAEYLGALIGKLRKRNPDMQEAAEEQYERFHGAPSKETIAIVQSEGIPDSVVDEVASSVPPEDFGALGELVSLKTDAGIVVEFGHRGDQKVYACTDPQGERIHFIGGDQSIDLDTVARNPRLRKNPIMGLTLIGNPRGKRRKNGGSVSLGQCAEIRYLTRKSFDDLHLVEYYHEFGEESGVQPELMYSPKDEHLYLRGGEYEIKPEGIVN